MVELLKRLIGAARNRDGKAEALEPGQGEMAAAAATPAQQRRRLATRPEAILHESLATKVMHGWLENRQQTLFPLVLNLRNLGGRERALLAEIMAATLAAGRAPPTEDRGEAARQALARLGAAEEEIRRLDSALERPRPARDLLADIQDAGIGPHAYAAALLATDVREPASRAWLGYLAARFALPPEVVVSLDRRYRQ
ncbi:MAG: DUF533 domain-containing protein [Acetobacteraceae bacterium]|nr:DUF533 domain-containing protein [Acetobacteraceae bacterium]